MGMENERLMPTKDLNEVQMGHLGHQVTKIGTSRLEEEKCELVDQLRRNINLFSLTPFGMSDIITKVKPREIHEG